MAFVAVSLGVAVLRKRHPRTQRRFRVPGGPYVIPGCSAVGSLALLAISPARILAMLGGWLVAGLGVYALCRRARARKVATA
ncbi:MAG: hypothetical protein EOO40_08185 [Deltaproteobacteria bacterium]|nr:MAG: hypothetical protein EOO40_08185 [Deltaproteobacteria bacterium]